MFIIFCPHAHAETDTSIRLPQPRLTHGKLLMQALQERRSTREFSPEPLPPEVLGDLLWAATGVNRPGSGSRTAPTAKNWQEIIVYVATAEGLFLYDPAEHMLKHIRSDDIRKHVGLQGFTGIAPVSLIYVADHKRMNGDDQEQNFYAATDTGFVSQNVYLYCASEGLATVVLGWVDKPALAEQMGLDKDQKVILTQPVGYPKTDKK